VWASIELDFEILTPGSRGVLGMGAEPAGFWRLLDRFSAAPLRSEKPRPRSRFRRPPTIERTARDATASTDMIETAPRDRRGATTAVLRRTAALAQPATAALAQPATVAPDPRAAAARTVVRAATPALDPRSD